MQSKFNPYHNVRVVVVYTDEELRQMVEDRRIFEATLGPGWLDKGGAVREWWAKLTGKRG